MTETGKILGTVPYMSPEQVRGDALDARTDIFSFGTLLYELLTGKRPFAAASPAESISAILTVDPPPLQHDKPAAVEFQRIVRKCLDKDRTRRYQATEDLVIDLKKLTRQDTSSVEAYEL
jgi:serine/threonine protein kinase